MMMMMGMSILVLTFVDKLVRLINFVVQDVFTVVSSAMCSVLFWNHAWSCQWQVGCQKFQQSSCMWSCSSNRQFKALESEMKSVDIDLININLTFFQPYPCEKFINVHFGCCHVWKYILMFITIAVVCIWDQFTHTYHKLLIWNIQLQINIFKNSKYYDDFLVTCEYHDFTLKYECGKKIESNPSINTPINYIGFCFFYPRIVWALIYPLVDNEHL